MRFSVLAPRTPGRYQLRLDLVSVPSGWFSKADPALPEVAVSVGEALWSAVVSVGAMRSQVFGSAQFEVPLRVTNNGSRMWSATGPSPVLLSYHWLRPNGSILTWDGHRTPLVSDVAPSATIAANAVVTTPNVPGVFQLEFDLVSSVSGWFSLGGSPTTRTTLTVGPHASRYFSATFGAASLPTRLDVHSVSSVSVTVTNSGTLPWPSSGASEVFLAYHWLRSDGSPLVWDGRRTSLSQSVGPRASVTQHIVVEAPDVVGRYRLRIDLVSASVGWFGAFGRPGPSSDVRIQSTQTGVSGFTRLPFWTIVGVVLLVAAFGFTAPTMLQMRRRSRWHGSL